MITTATEVLKPALKPAISDGAGPETFAPPESPNSTTSSPVRSALNSFLTKQHMPTYSNSSSVTSLPLHTRESLQQAVCKTLSDLQLLHPLAGGLAPQGATIPPSF